MKELLAFAVPGQVGIYAVLEGRASEGNGGKVRNVSAGAWETLDLNPRSEYALALAEGPVGSGKYYGDLPPDLSSSVAWLVTLYDSSDGFLGTARMQVEAETGPGSFTDDDREKLGQILAKPSGGGGAVAVVGMDRKQVREMAQETARVVWTAKERTLTGSVRIEGEMQTLDELQDLSAEEVAVVVGEALDARGLTAELAAALGSLESQTTASARAGKVWSLLLKTAEQIEGRLLALEGAAEAARAESVHASARILGMRFLTREEIADETHAAMEPLRTELGALALAESGRLEAHAAAENGRRVAEEWALAVSADQAEMRRMVEAMGDSEERRRVLARLAAIDARIQVARAEISKAGEASDVRIKLIARGVASLLTREVPGGNGAAVPIAAKD